MQNVEAVLVAPNQDEIKQAMAQVISVQEKILRKAFKGQRWQISHLAEKLNYTRQYIQMLTQYRDFPKITTESYRSHTVDAFELMRWLLRTGRFHAALDHIHCSEPEAKRRGRPRKAA